MRRKRILSLALPVFFMAYMVAASDASGPVSGRYSSVLNEHIERLDHSDVYQRTLAAYRLGMMDAWAAPAMPDLISMLEDCEDSACEWSWRLDTITTTTVDPDTFSVQRKASHLLSVALEHGTIPRPDGGYKKEYLAVNEIDVPPSQMTLEHFSLMGKQDRSVGAYALGMSPNLSLEQTILAYNNLDSLGEDWRNTKAHHQGNERERKAEQLVSKYEASINLLWGIEGVVKSLCRGLLAEYLAANLIEKEISELTTDDYRRIGERARLYSPCREAAAALTRITGRDFGTDAEKWRDLTEHTILITGRLIDKNQAPIAGRRIGLYEAIFDLNGRQVFRLRIDERGRVMNPGTATDEAGWFAFAADRRFWEEGSGEFTLAIYVQRLSGGITVDQQQPLRNTEGIPIAIEVHPDARKVTVEDVVVE